MRLRRDFNEIARYANYKVDLHVNTGNMTCVNVGMCPSERKHIKLGGKLKKVISKIWKVKV